MASVGAGGTPGAAMVASVPDWTSQGVGDPEDRRIQGHGTSEAVWRHQGELQRLPQLSLARLAPLGANLVVVAPHPDDEVLACGGALSMLSKAGRSIQVLGVTDGEASYAGSDRWPPELLGIARRTERQVGLTRLGTRINSISLQIPDGKVDRFENELATAVERVLKPGDIVLTTWRFDGHPDHEAAGRAAFRAASNVGCQCWEMPVWMWHWAEPRDARVPWHRLRRLELTPLATLVKSHAIAAHASQLQAIEHEQRPAVLPDWALARLLRPFETFFEPESLS